MTTATAQDEDLLIIADDQETAKDSDDIEFSFDFGEDSKETTPKAEVTPAEVTPEVEIPETDAKADSLEGKMENLEVAAMDTTPVLDVVEEEAVVSPEVDASPEIDLGMNFDTPTEEAKVEAPAEVVKTENEEISFGINLEESTPAVEAANVTETETASIVEEPISIMEEVDSVEETQEVATQAEETPVVKDDSSMNDILATTIAKLSARQEAIATDKAAKTSQEEQLKEKIKELQAQVKELEAEMKTLDSESDKITANIEQLESMKLDPVKDHNARRAKK